MRHVMRDFVHFLCRIVTRVQIVHSRQNHVLNVGFAVPDCPPNYCSKFSEQSVPLHLPSIVQVIWADIQFSYRLENCFLLLSDCESMLLRHLQDVCENLGDLNRFFPCWCHTKSVGSWHGFMVNIVLFEWNGLMLQILSVSLCSKIVTLL